MENLTIQLETPLAMAVAVSKGWTPTIDDTSVEMVDDVYPQIPNPISYIKYLEGFIPEFIKEFVLIEGRKLVNNEFNSISESVKSQVDNGTFDNMILAGDIQGIKNAVVGSL